MYVREAKGFACEQRGALPVLGFSLTACGVARRRLHTEVGVSVTLKGPLLRVPAESHVLQTVGAEPTPKPAWPTCCPPL